MDLYCVRMLIGADWTIDYICRLNAKFKQSASYNRSSPSTQKSPHSPYPPTSAIMPANGDAYGT
jgi:hypothetical protein